MGVSLLVAPLNIRLIGAHQPLSAGHRYDLLCQSAGSRPAASITWFLDGIRLDKSKETTSADGNQTTSTLSISLNRTDAGKYLSCKAYNTYVPSDALEDGWQLDIQYVPDAQVRLGSSLDPDSIREGTDVYFDCIVTAHPGVYKVEWKHNGVIISNQSLVLQGVSRTTAGNYSCVGFNAEGEGASPVFPLNVMYAPTCAPNQQRVYGVAKQENAEIRCVVDANPPDVEFKWTFNNSAESIDVQASHISRLVGTSSVVSYTPMTELDYGTLLCVATNRIGKQRQACVFHIIAADDMHFTSLPFPRINSRGVESKRKPSLSGVICDPVVALATTVSAAICKGRPDQVHNCSLANVSMTSLNVRCYEGFNGGLAQSFFLELRDTHTQEVRFNNTAPIPRFAVPNLHPSAVYQLSVYAFNSKGKSEPYVMSAATLRLPEKQMNSEKTERPRSPLPLTPTLSIAIGLGAAILIGSCAIVLAFKFPCGGATRRRNKETGHHNHQSTTVRTSSPGPSDKSVASKEYDGNESDEKNPDVIPDTIDSDDQMEYIRRRQHISTIDTSSPSRLLLTTTSAVASQAQQQNFMGSTMTLGGNHASLGYCTLRNGGGMGLGPQNQVVTNVSMAHGVGPTAAGLSLGGPGVSMAPHHWPSYGGTIAGVRNLTAISVTSSQHTIPPPPPSTIAMQHLGGAGTLPRGGGAGASFLDHHQQQHQHQQQQPRSRVCLAEEDVSADTPLMVKRESTV
ncbi:conserved hypothetical protein [Culex quinquefasciatus]|uniref:Sidestep protein n=1 Tax=Culex quinquefasciatus TaxID=7176 RepID=B0XDI5_CULQU|nr:conserved hypothetical protein [Culex quinquefasciatus]|eukprot:XP_001867707.1 conserved hypothetical protein [Culex quinquefasciatus]